VVDLTQCRGIQDAEAETNVLNAFVLQMSTRSYYLYAGSGAEKDDWMNGIRSVLATIVRSVHP